MKTMSFIASKHPVNTVARRSLLITAISLVIAGCGGSKTVPTKAPDYVEHSVRTLAIAPSSDLDNDLFGNDSSRLAEAIGVELSKRGYTVIDAGGSTAILTKYDIPRVPMLAPQALAALGKEGVDAVLSVSSEGSVIGGPGMRHVKVRLTGTHAAKQIGEIAWHNAWGGMPGSPADFTMRKDQAAAAREIAVELAKLLG